MNVTNMTPNMTNLFAMNVTLACKDTTDLSTTNETSSHISIENNFVLCFNIIKFYVAVALKYFISDRVLYKVTFIFR